MACGIDGTGDGAHLIVAGDWVSLPFCLRLRFRAITTHQGLGFDCVVSLMAKRERVVAWVGGQWTRELVRMSGGMKWDEVEGGAEVGVGDAQQSRGAPVLPRLHMCLVALLTSIGRARPVHGNLGESGRRHSDTPRESPSTVVAMLPQPAQIRPRVPSIYLSHGPHAAPSCR